MAQDAEITTLIDLNQLAEKWRVSPHTIRGWVARRRLNPTRICRRLLFTSHECERFLRSKDYSPMVPESEQSSHIPAHSGVQV